MGTRPTNGTVKGTGIKLPSRNEHDNGTHKTDTTNGEKTCIQTSRNGIRTAEERGTQYLEGEEGMERRGEQTKQQIYRTESGDHGRRSTEDRTLETKNDTVTRRTRYSGNEADSDNIPGSGEKTRDKIEIIPTDTLLDTS